MLESAKQLKKNYFWNTLGSLMNAASSALLLLVVTRFTGAYSAGVFSIAYAVGQQFLSVGSFEMRTYQATDSEGRFPFSVYLGSRVVTVVLMALTIIVYALYADGLTYDALLIILIAGLRFFDASEDVFHGMFQQRGRLDIAGRAFFFRVLTTTVLFGVGAILTGDLLTCCLLSAAGSLVIELILNLPPAKKYENAIRPSFEWKPLARLIAACFPLFIASFLLNDLVNVPRFGIEAVMQKEAQTVYSILYMPAMITNLIVGFVFKPLLTSLAEKWSSGDRLGYYGILGKGAALIVVALILAMAAAYPFGTPALSWLYGVDVSSYRTELMAILIGGAFNALSVILYYGLVTVRLQGLVVVGYGISALVAHALSGVMIAESGLMGAVLLYDLSMGLLAALFVAFLLFGLRIIGGRS